MFRTQTRNPEPMMPTDVIERVLCVKTTELRRVLVRSQFQQFREPGLFQRFRPFVNPGHAAEVLEAIMEAEPEFLPRTPELEADPSYKQLIPYGVVQHGTETFGYWRAKKGDGDKRLKGRCSVGFGGHVNPPDSGSALSETLSNCLEREVEREELEVRAGKTVILAGLLNDDSNPVGSVHLGVVFEIKLDAPDVRPRAQEIENTGWCQPESLRSVLSRHGESVETWSRILIEDWLAALKPEPAPAS